MKDDMPTFGIGPTYVGIISVVTLVSLVLDHLGLMPDWSPLPPLFCIVSSVVLIAAGIAIWYTAVMKDRVSEGISEDRLITTGIYAYVRNPIYTAFMFMNWGLLLASGNTALLVIAPTYWILMTAMVESTEERWLSAKFGEEYTEYCRRVNRCIPWFPRER